MSWFSHAHDDYLDPDKHLWPSDDFCDVCGEYVDNCKCPECPVCKMIGNPECITNGGSGCWKEKVE